MSVGVGHKRRDCPVAIRRERERARTSLSIMYKFSLVLLMIR